MMLACGRKGQSHFRSGEALYVAQRSVSVNCNAEHLATFRTSCPPRKLRQSPWTVAQLRVGVADNLVDAGLVEALIALVALKDFQVRTDRARIAKRIGLLLGDGARCQRRPNPFRLDRPDFAFGKGLLEVGQVREGFENLNTCSPQLLSGRVEIELALEVVHPGLQKRLAVQLAPQADRSQTMGGRKRLVGEVPRDFIRPQVYVGEDDDQAFRLFQHLSPPTGLLARIDSLTAF